MLSRKSGFAVGMQGSPAARIGRPHKQIGRIMRSKFKEKKVNEDDEGRKLGIACRKVLVVGLIIGLAIGIASTRIFIAVWGFGRTGSVDELAAANARATAEIVERFRDTNTEQRTIIGDLESENQRLEEHLRDAGRISESLTGTVEASGAYTASAVEISKRLRKGISNLENWYNDIRREYPGIVGLEFNQVDKRP
jgi:hypothetical protein